MSEFSSGCLTSFLFFFYIVVSDSHLNTFGLGFISGIYLSYKILGSSDKLKEYTKLNQKIRCISDQCNNYLTKIRLNKKRKKIIYVQAWWRKILARIKYQKLIIKILILQSISRKWLYNNTKFGFIHPKIIVSIKTCWANQVPRYTLNFNPKKDIFNVNKSKNENIYEKIKIKYRLDPLTDVWLVKLDQLVTKDGYSVIIIPKPCKHLSHGCLCIKCLNWRRYHDKLSYSHTNPYSIKKIKKNDFILAYQIVKGNLMIEKFSYCLKNYNQPFLSQYTSSSIMTN